MTTEELYKGCEEKFEKYLTQNEYCKKLYSNIKEEDKKDMILYSCIDCLDFLKKRPEWEGKEKHIISYFVRRMLSPQVRHDNDKKIIIPL